MPTPTETGWYWCKGKNSGWAPRAVLCMAYDPRRGADKPVPACSGCALYAHESMSVADVYAGTSLVPLAELDCTWGERIPDNGRLKAMRQMADADPTGALPMFKENERCIYCGNRIDLDAIHDRPELDHAAVCPWLKAQETKPPLSDDQFRALAEHVHKHAPGAVPVIPVHHEEKGDD